MSPRTTSPSVRRRKSIDDPTVVSVLWPIVLGILITFVTVWLASVLAMMGPEQFAVLYPWVALVRSPFLRIEYVSAVSIGQTLMYLQFPIYGLIGGLVNYSTNSVTKAFFTVLSVHLVALIIFIVITIFLP